MFSWKCGAKRILGRSSPNERIMLKWILKKLGVTVYTDFYVPELGGQWWDVVVMVMNILLS